MFKFAVLAALLVVCSAAGRPYGHHYGAPSYHSAPKPYAAPAYHAPVYKAPSYHAPSYHAPAHHAPSYHAPSYHAPAYASYSAPAPAYGGYGHSDYAVPTPYEFGYDIAGDYGEFKQNRKESSDGKGNVQGSYGYTDAHGIYRQVDYVADAHGYRANVKTNEPGTDNQNPADVQVYAQPAHYQAAPHYGGYPKY